MTCASNEDLDQSDQSLCFAINGYLRAQRISLVKVQNFQNPELFKLKILKLAGRLQKLIIKVKMINCVKII